MHIFFSGIGGSAIGPLTLIARQAGHQVSGSDKQDSVYIHYLKKAGLTDIYIGQNRQQIEELHNKNPIDWYVYSSAITKENVEIPEMTFCHEQNIKVSKRDELINRILQDKGLRMIAIAGTHGKTTTTAMVIWLFKALEMPLSYSVGAKISFGDMGQYEVGSEYFIYECDEFDRNFLAYEPYLSLITGVSWDHHEIFPTREDYQQAFREFIEQSQQTMVWREDFDYLQLKDTKNCHVLDANIADSGLNLVGQYNRLDAWLATQAVHKISKEPLPKLIKIMNDFPGLSRRMEQIAPNLYSDYAHTPEKIIGAMSVATEMAEKSGQKVIVVYEPLTNRRQHHMMNDYKDCFNGATKVYWIPSYLAREDPAERIMPPQELISHLDDPSIAEPKERDTDLKQTIQKHLDQGDMVVCMAGGGGNSLDEWIRKEFKP